MWAAWTQLESYIIAVARRQFSSFKVSSSSLNPKSIASHVLSYAMAKLRRHQQAYADVMIDYMRAQFTIVLQTRQAMLSSRSFSLRNHQKAAQAALMCSYRVLLNLSVLQLPPSEYKRYNIKCERRILKATGKIPPSSSDQSAMPGNLSASTSG